MPKLSIYTKKSIFNSKLEISIYVNDNLEAFAINGGTRVLRNCKAGNNKLQVGFKQLFNYQSNVLDIDLQENEESTFEIEFNQILKVIFIFNFILFLIFFISLVFNSATKFRWIAIYILAFQLLLPIFFRNNYFNLKRVS